MKAGVVSDTHGSTENLREAVEWLVSAEGVDALIHLGDDVSDLREIGSLPSDVRTVPGVFEDAYRDPGVKNRLLLDFEGVKVLLTHTPASHENDLPGDMKPGDAAASGADLVLHGHTHAARIEKEGSAVFVNPGHLKPSDARGGEPSFAVVDFSARRVEIISLNGKKALMRGRF